MQLHVPKACPPDATSCGQERSLGSCSLFQNSLKAVERLIWVGLGSGHYSKALCFGLFAETPKWGTNLYTFTPPPNLTPLLPGICKRKRAKPELRALKLMSCPELANTEFSFAHVHVVLALPAVINSGPSHWESHILILCSSGLFVYILCDAAGTEILSKCWCYQCFQPDMAV